MKRIQIKIKYNDYGNKAMLPIIIRPVLPS